MFKCNRPFSVISDANGTLLPLARADAAESVPADEDGIVLAVHADRAAELPVHLLDFRVVRGT